MTRPRVGIVGARRARQGLGPFVARELQRSGAEVVAFAGTSEASLRQASEALAGVGVSGARGYPGVEALLGAEVLDALAIVSPAETHAACLEAALAAGLSVLCEKPFVWDVEEPAATARRLVQEFAARGLRLRENCQWPFVLPAFASLHPAAIAPGRPPRRFAMRLSPSAVGTAMLVDALPHPLSLLQALTGDAPAEIAALRFSSRDPRAERLRLDFVYAGDRFEIEVALDFVGRSASPREASLSIDGFAARRTIRAGDYALALGDGPRVVPLPDPLASLVAEFVCALAVGAPTEPPAGAIARRMESLCRIVRAFDGSER